MKPAQSVQINAWTLITVNLLMAFCCIWIFMRMAPAIEVIIDRNELSLQACEDMLASLALTSDSPGTDGKLLDLFSNALERAKNNITEPEEPEALERISTHYQSAFMGNTDARKKTVTAITLLGKINRKAMIKADHQAQQLGKAGAWGIVFMGTAVFFIGLLFIKRMTRYLIEPIQEIHNVVTAQLKGDSLRRCSGVNLPRNIKLVFDDMNEFIDKLHAVGDKTIDR